MRRLMHFIPALVLIILQATSCRLISAYIHDDEIVAEAAGHQLYRSELDAAVPAGMTVEDSTYFARQYIVNWASNCIYQDAAEKNLSDSEKNVEKELADYRVSLLKYRYEKRYVNERLDTVVTDQEVQEYYEKNIGKFTLTSPVFKGRFLKISEDSPMLAVIRKKMSSDEVDDVFAADSLAYSSAQKFETWNDGWVDFSVMTEEFEESEKTLLSIRKGNWIERSDGLGTLNLLYISDIRYAGSKAPYEYCVPRIEDIIISNRKYALVSNLERDLLEEARKNGNFVIY